jgi:Mrp family chromosome partitioning ATPase
LGYPAAPGWHPHPTLSPHTRTLLSSELSQQSAEDCVTIAVSGTRTPSDRRAAVAVEIALVLANAGDRRVLLVEADFRNPGIAPLLHLQVPEAVDFASELGRRAAGSGGASLGVLLCTDTLHVLPSAGSRPGDPVLTTHFDACLRLTRDFYDVVVIHAPPTAAGVFLTAVADVVDGIIVVGEDASRLPAGFSKKAFVRTVSA